MVYQVLIIDDDLKISTLLQKLFNTDNFISLYVLNTKEAREIIEYIEFDALVVDYMMPDENGIDFLSDLRANNINTPALMLTAVDEIENKLNALEQASDDYLTKPFNSKELLLRIKNLIKRNAPYSSYTSANLIQVGDILYNKANHSLKIKNKDIKLSSMEDGIFRILLENINVAMDKEDILKNLGKHINESNINTLSVSIMRLRKKIEEDNNNPKYLKTIRGRGFILVNG